jgi:hypothetical protein
MDEAVQSPVTAVELRGSIEVRSSAEPERLAKVEAAVGKLEKRKSLWEVLQAIIPGAVLAIVGYYLNDSVNHAFQEKQLEYSTIREMQTLVVDLENAPDRKAAFEKASQLATFGKYSVPMLISQLDIGNPNSQMATEKALRTLGANDAKTVCNNLVAIIRNRSKVYSWHTHLVALSMTGDLACTSARAAIDEYIQDLTKQDFNQWVTASAEPKFVNDVKAQAQATADRLHALPRGWLQR